jgi:hypothetical protein
MSAERAFPRDSDVRLDAAEARCEPRLPCVMRSHCARYMATMPSFGGSMMDGTSDPLWTPSGCPHYLRATSSKPAHTGPERRKVKHWSSE